VDFVGCQNPLLFLFGSLSTLGTDYRSPTFAAELLVRP
jgi:hypothetical protein